MTFTRSSRPERQQADQHNQRAAKEYYDARDNAAKYTAAAARTGVQNDLALRALAYLLSAPRVLALEESKDRGSNVDLQTVLDLGCGSGLSSAILSAFGFMVLGADISYEMLALASLSQSS